MTYFSKRGVTAKPKRYNGIAIPRDTKAPSRKRDGANTPESIDMATGTRAQKRALRAAMHKLLPKKKHESNREFNNRVWLEGEHTGEYCHTIIDLRKE